MAKHGSRHQRMMTPPARVNEIKGEPFSIDSFLRDAGRHGTNKGMSGNPSHPNASAPLGQGGRFAALKQKLSRQGVRDPAALAASIGRKKFGAKRFAKLAAKGR